MVLVALSMFAVIAMAALSIDLVALYLAREEAQRSADAAALAGARVLSLTGVTGDPDNAQDLLPAPPWPTACALATQVAQAVANQNSVGSTVATSATVSFLYNGTANDCTAPAGGFSLNPQVQVKVVRQSLPAFFARMWGQTTNSVSATAIAEAYNSSNSGLIAPNGIVPVNPRCVKPWIIPNIDPSGGGALINVNPAGSSSIASPGIRLSFAPPGLVIGEEILLMNRCGAGPGCGTTPLGAIAANYVPALIAGNSVAYPSCANGSPFEQAVGGCDVGTQYACGIQGGGMQADLSASYNADTVAAAQCLIRWPAQDTLNTSQYPYQIQPGASNPIAATGTLSSSTSIVTLPIYDNSQAPGTLTPPSPAVTIVGFLQVFINQSFPSGNLDVTVLNIAGCGNGSGPVTNGVGGISPVPIRLITP